MIRFYLLIFGFLFSVSGAYAFNLSTWFENLNQRAARLLKEEKFAEAEKTFTRNDWKAVASYRGKNYKVASERFKQLGGELGFYNQGNALAYLGQYKEAIAAYEKAIKLNPKHEDAIYNRDLLKKLLEDNKDNQNQQDQDQNQNQQDRDKKQQNNNQKQQNNNQKEQNKDRNEQQQDQNQQEQNQQEKEQDENKQDSNKGEQINNKSPQDSEQREQEQSKIQPEKEQVLRLIPDDPGGLLREKFWRDHWRRLKEERP